MMQCRWQLVIKCVSLMHHNLTFYCNCPLGVRYSTVSSKEHLMPRFIMAHYFHQMLWKNSHQVQNKNVSMQDCKVLRSTTLQDIMKWFREVSCVKTNGWKPLVTFRVIIIATWVWEIVGKPVSLSTVWCFIQKCKMKEHQEEVRQ